MNRHVCAYIRIHVYTLERDIVSTESKRETYVPLYLQKARESTHSRKRHCIREYTLSKETLYQPTLYLPLYLPKATERDTPAKATERDTPAPTCENEVVFARQTETWYLRKCAREKDTHTKREREREREKGTGRDR